MLKYVVLSATALGMFVMGYLMRVDYRGIASKNLAEHRRFWRGHTNATMETYRRGGIVFMAFGVLFSVLLVWSAVSG